MAGFWQRLMEGEDELQQRGKGSAAAAVPGVTTAGGRATEAAGNGIQHMAPTV